MRTNTAKAFRRGLLKAVMEHGKVKTPLARAKSVQGELDKLINLFKDNSVNARRQIVKILGGNFKLTGDFSERNSGYSRIIRLGQRMSDATEMVTLELIKKKEPEVLLAPEPVKEPKQLEKPKLATKKAKKKS